MDGHTFRISYTDPKGWKSIGKLASVAFIWMVTHLGFHLWIQKVEIGKLAFVAFIWMDAHTFRISYTDPKGWKKKIGKLAFVAYI